MFPSWVTCAPALQAATILRMPGSIPTLPTAYFTHHPKSSLDTRLHLTLLPREDWRAGAGAAFWYRGVPQ